MKNYIIGLFCITFLFACGGSDNSSSSSEVVETKVEQKDDSAAKAFIKEFSDEYMASCAAEGNEQGFILNAFIFIVEKVLLNCFNMLTFLKKCLTCSRVFILLHICMNQFQLKKYVNM